MRRLLLLRHGQSTWNAEGRWQGWADPPLSELGREQARWAAVSLLSVGFHAVVSSDLRRARETAEIVATELGLGSVDVVPGLRERDVGAWSGLTSDEIEAKWPGQLDEWRAGQLAQIPEGEGDIAGRVMAALDEVLVSHHGDTVLAVTHGGVIRSTERALGVEPSRVRNVGGRWVLADDGAALRAGEVVVLPEPDATEPTTTTIL